MLCQFCKNEISSERLEILPDTKLCLYCATGHEQPVVVQRKARKLRNIAPALIDKHPDYYKEKERKSRKKQIKHEKKYTQLPGLNKRMRNSSVTSNLIPVDYGNNKVYKYSVKKFSDTFKINEYEASAAVSGGYTFICTNGVLYMKHANGRSIRVGNVNNRKTQ